MERKRESSAPNSNDDPKRHKPVNTSSFEYLKNEYHTTIPWRNNVAAKLNSASPFNFFLTRVKDIRETYDEDLSITFWELLDPSLGDIEHIVFITFIVDVAWLLAQCAVVGRANPPITVLYDNSDPDQDIANLPPHIRLKAFQIPKSDPFGHHHSKMMVFFYKDNSARIVVTTANLTESDWENRTQGVWISGLLPALKNDAPPETGESVTYFRRDVIQYLEAYKLVDLKNWIDRLKITDMSSVMVALISSVPGSHFDHSFGYPKLREVLREHVTSTNSHSWSLIAQCSSIGSLGPAPRSWLCGPFGRALDEKASKDVSVMVMYPALSNVRGSVDGMLGGACLPYMSRIHLRQKWLNDHLWQWKSEGRHRSRAVPHLKTYTKLSPNGTRAAWFLLTSANLSQAAWGGPTAAGVRIRSHEVGVLFLPKFLTGESEFRVKRNGSFDDSEDFPFPYDTPLTPYSAKDQIFLYDKCFTEG